MMKIIASSRKSAARFGKITTGRGNIATPFFMPIATKGAVKALGAEDLKKLGASIILANTYHLALRPGVKILTKAGGLREFMNWNGPILTDSGGFQVFSLTKIRKILPDGVRFRSYLDGSEIMLTPASSLEIQEAIGSDIRMALDVCPAYPATRKTAQEAVDLTTKWARESLKHFNPSPKVLLFGIIQGSVYKDLRLQSARDLVSLNFDGYAIGGLAVGESEKEMYKVIDWVAPALPKDKPRYLMGAGKPEQIIESVKRGIDMFDCVIPTREARHGRLYLWSRLGRGLNKQVNLARKDFYRTIQITNAKFSRDMFPINSVSKMPELRQYSKAYLRHLFKTEEPLALRLATLNNVEFYLDLMRQIRLGIRQGQL